MQISSSQQFGEKMLSDGNPMEVYNPTDAYTPKEFYNN